MSSQSGDDVPSYGTIDTFKIAKSLEELILLDAWRKDSAGNQDILVVATPAECRWSFLSQTGETGGKWHRSGVGLCLPDGLTCAFSITRSTCSVTTASAAADAGRSFEIINTSPYGTDLTYVSGALENVLRDAGGGDWLRTFKAVSAMELIFRIAHHNTFLSENNIEREQTVRLTDGSHLHIRATASPSLAASYLQVKQKTYETSCSLWNFLAKERGQEEVLTAVAICSLDNKQYIILARRLNPVEGSDIDCSEEEHKWPRYGDLLLSTGGKLTTSYIYRLKDWNSHIATLMQEAQNGGTRRQSAFQLAKTAGVLHKAPEFLAVMDSLIQQVFDSLKTSQDSAMDVQTD